MQWMHFYCHHDMKDFRLCWLRHRRQDSRVLLADNITLSCNLSGNMKFLPIDGVNESWSKEILSSKTNDRSAGVEIIKKTLVNDIYDLTNQIQDYFLN